MRNWLVRALSGSQKDAKRNVDKKTFDNELRKLNNAVDLRLLPKKERTHLRSLILQDHFFYLIQISIPGSPVIYAGREFCRFTGFTEDELLMKPVEEIGRMLCMDQFAKDADRLRAAMSLEADLSTTVLLVCATKDGVKFSNKLTMRQFLTIDGLDQYASVESIVEMLPQQPEQEPCVAAESQAQPAECPPQDASGISSIV